MTAISDSATVVHGFMPDSVDHTVQELRLHSVVVVSADWHRVNCWVCWDLKDKSTTRREDGSPDQRP